jgi:hypothetical protein
MISGAVPKQVFKKRDQKIQLNGLVYVDQHLLRTCPPGVLVEQACVINLFLQHYQVSTTYADDLQQTFGPTISRPSKLDDWVHTHHTYSMDRLIINQLGDHNNNVLNAMQI